MLNPLATVAFLGYNHGLDRWTAKTSELFWVCEVDASSAVALRKLLHHVNSLSTEGPSESHRSELCADCSRQATRERIREGPMPGLPLSDSSSGIGRGPPMFAIEWSGKMKSGKKFAEAKRGKEGISCLYGPVLRAGVALPSPTTHSIPHKHKLALQKFGW